MSYPMIGGLEAADFLFGDHTRRALDNTPPARSLNDFAHAVESYAQVKKACALANAEFGAIPQEIANAITQAADEVIAGKHSAQFPTPLVVGGGGTTSNMNLNEVLAARASELGNGDLAVHPNDHVNRSQSSNDTFPTAMAVTVISAADDLAGPLQVLIDSLRRKASEYEGVDHLGRTCLNDAVALPIAATHNSQARALERTLLDFQAAVDGLKEVPLGGTVIGSGVGAPDGFAEVAVAHLANETGIDLKPSSDIYDGMSNSDPYSRVAGELRRISQVIYKLCADLRFLASGPNGGINEVRLPGLQKGSSIMPGKINPTIPEVVMSQMLLVRGHTYVVDESVDAGELEINVMAGVMLQSILEAIESLIASAPLLAKKCIDGLEWNRELLEAKLATGFDASVERATVVGYEQSSKERATAAQSSAGGGDQS